MIYWNTNSQEKENHLDQLYTVLADIIKEEVKDDETDDERSVS